MKLVFFIAIILFFAAEFVYENSFIIRELHFQWVSNNSKSISNKNSHEENVHHYNSQVINYLIMKCGGC